MSSSPYFSFCGKGVISSSSILAQGALEEYDRLVNFRYNHPMAAPTTTTETRTATTIPAMAPVERPSEVPDALAAATVAREADGLALLAIEGVCVMVRTVAVDVVGVADEMVVDDLVVEEEDEEDTTAAVEDDDRAADYLSVLDAKVYSL